MEHRHGDKHTPGIIRMGMNVHHSVASVSMEALVERRLEATKESRVGLRTPFLANIVHVVRGVKSCRAQASATP